MTRSYSNLPASVGGKLHQSTQTQTNLEPSVGDVHSDDQFEGIDPSSDIAIHGLSNIVHTSARWAKAFWKLIFLLGVCGFVYYMIRIIIEYNNRPVLISLETVSMLNMSIPDTTICFNRLSMIDRNQSTIDPIWYPVLNLQDEPLATVTLEETLGLSNMSIYYKVDWREVLKAQGPKCNETFLRCSIGFKYFNCCELLRPVYVTEGGACFTVNNLTQFYVQTSPRPELGLRMLINTADCGLAIGFPMLYNGIVVNCGTETQIALYTSRISRNPSRRGGCRKNDPNAMSSEDNCQVAVFDTVIQQLCKCTLDRMVVHASHISYESNLPLCNPIWYYICLGKHSKEIETEFRWQIQTHCIVDRCYTWEFQPTPTAIALQSNRINDILHINHSLASQYIILSIYHPILGYKEFKERIVMSFDALIGAIGGQMGLFLGASIISFIQASVYLVHQSTKLIENLRSRKIIPKHATDSNSTSVTET